MSEAASRTAPRTAHSLTAGLEAALKLRLADRRIWLINGCGLCVTLMLTLVQARTEAFDTLQLMSRLMLVVEATLLLTAWLLAADTAGRSAAQGARPARLTLGLSSGIVLLLQLGVQLLPLLYFHRYPELALEGLRVPLLLLQRGLLLTLGVIAVHHLILALTLQLRVASWIAAPAVLACYAWASLALTRLSQTNPTFKRLNDLFYWNQLSVHLPDLPDLQTAALTHNMEGPWLAFYLLVFAGLAIGSTLLWVPAAIKLDSRETKSS